MRRESDEQGLPVFVLSRRNLMALLAKLDGFPAGSACTIGSPDGSWYVRAEEDSVHYSERAPGRMHPTTEHRLRDRGPGGDGAPGGLMYPHPSRMGGPGG